MSEVRVRAYRADEDEAWATRLLERLLAGRLQVRRGELIDVLAGEALVAERDGAPVGLAAFARGDDVWDLEALAAEDSGSGVGTTLVEALAAAAGAAGGHTLRVLTTNDNLAALRFYQRRGFRLDLIRPGAVDVARSMKPSIPEIGSDGIPLRDEIELVRSLR